MIDAPVHSRRHAAQYARFFIVGTVVGLLAIVLRELIALALPADRPFHYSLSVLIVYALGIIGSYVLHHSYTFRHPRDLVNARVFLPYVLVALTGAASTWGLSLLLRYGLDFDGVFRSSELHAFTKATWSECDELTFYRPFPPGAEPETKIVVSDTDRPTSSGYVFA